MNSLGSELRSRVARLLCGGVTLFAGTLGLSGCGTIQGTTAQIAQLRIIDASPDAGGIDVYAGNAAIAYNIGFGTITSYVPATPGTYTLAADTAGTRTALASARATLLNGKQNTLLMNNVAASLGLTVLTDQSQPAPSGQISIRFLDEAMSVGAVDLYLVPTGAALSTVVPVATNVTFTQNTGYLNVPVGTYQLYVLANGTTISSTTVPIYIGAATAYPSGSARTIVLFDKQLVTTPSLTVTTIPDFDAATAVQ